MRMKFEDYRSNDTVASELTLTISTRLHSSAFTFYWPSITVLACYTTPFQHFVHLKLLEQWTITIKSLVLPIRYFSPETCVFVAFEISVPGSSFKEVRVSVRCN